MDRIEKKRQTIEQYNEKLKGFWKVPLSLCAENAEILKECGLEWLQYPVDFFVQSINESKPIIDMDETLVESTCVRDFHEYAVESYQKLLNALCIIATLCSGKPSLTNALYGESAEMLVRYSELYTKYSNRISKEISCNWDGIDSRHADAFIAIPDLKADISVDSITNYRFNDNSCI